MRRLGLFAVFLVALVAAGFAGALFSGHLNQNNNTQTVVTTRSTALSATTTTLPHASIKVLVANGTQQNGAAAHLTQVLQAQGWSMSTPTNTISQASATTVYYAPTKQPEAALIASELGVNPSAVQPLTVTAPLAGTTGIDVVVVIGPDLASREGTLTPAT
jgi:hypothetical protein